jgi:hypothetical protein
LVSASGSSAYALGPDEAARACADAHVERLEEGVGREGVDWRRRGERCRGLNNRAIFAAVPGSPARVRAYPPRQRPQAGAATAGRKASGGRARALRCMPECAKHAHASSHAFPAATHPLSGAATSAPAERLLLSVRLPKAPRGPPGGDSGELLALPDAGERAAGRPPRVGVDAARPAAAPEAPAATTPVFSGRSGGGEIGERGADSVSSPPIAA